MWLAENITWKSCIFEIVSNSTMLMDNHCAGKDEKAECISSGGKCRTDIDGYYIEVAINVVYGVIWYQFGKRLLVELQKLPRQDWHVLSSQTEKEVGEATPLEDAGSKA